VACKDEIQLRGICGGRRKSGNGVEFRKIKVPQVSSKTSKKVWRALPVRVVIMAALESADNPAGELVQKVAGSGEADEDDGDFDHGRKHQLPRFCVASRRLPTSVASCSTSWQ